MTKNIGVVLNSDGSISIGDVTYQNQKNLLFINPRELKEYPTSCVGAKRFVESDDVDGLSRKIRTEFTQDGMTVTKINVNISTLEIEANY